MLTLSITSHSDSTTPDSSSNFATSINIGTLGIGASIFYKINDSFQVRGLVGSSPLSQEIEQEDLVLDSKISGTHLGAVIDYYPFKEDFRLFAGYLHYGNKLEFRAVTDDGILVVSGEEYDTSSEVESITGEITTPTAAGIFGIGWGNPILANKKLGFMFDMGVVLLNGSTVDMEAKCYPNALTCHALQTNVADEEAKLQEKVNDVYKFWPYLNLAMSYHF